MIFGHDSKQAMQVTFSPAFPDATVIQKEFEIQ